MLSIIFLLICGALYLHIAPLNNTFVNEAPHGNLISKVTCADNLISNGLKFKYIDNLLKKNPEIWDMWSEKHTRNAHKPASLTWLLVIHTFGQLN